MKLEPLKQWVCDTCGEIIQKPEDGYAEFNFERDEFRIVHHLSASPRNQSCSKGCYRCLCGLPLPSLLGADGVAGLFSLVDPGEHHVDQLKNPTTKDFRKWVTFFRRLQTPYYEEARLYWAQASEDRFFKDTGEMWAYLPSTLQELVLKYRKLYEPYEQSLESEGEKSDG